jgi:energy-coupling factor transporter transmembrane protein EcfT
MKRWQAATALAISLEAAVLGMIVERPVSLALVAAVAAVWTAPVVSRRAWPWLLAALALMSWTLMLTQGLFWTGEPRTVWLRLLPPEGFPFGDPPGLFLYREGALHGLAESLRGHALLWIAAGIVARYGIEELARGLRALGVPGAASLLTVLAVRQMPLLVDEARTVWTALRLKGLGRARALRALWVPLLTGHLRRADEIAAALHARGLGMGTEEPLPPPAPAAERRLVWAGGLGVAAAAAAVGLTRLHEAGLWSVPGADLLYAWVLAYV